MGQLIFLQVWFHLCPLQITAFYFPKDGLLELDLMDFTLLDELTVLDLTLFLLREDADEEREATDSVSS